MIQGITNFTEYFKDNSDDYVVIGGLATAMIMNDLGFIARATKDIDLVVISKNNEDFLKKLLNFVDIAGYKTKQRTNIEKADSNTIRNILKEARIGKISKDTIIELLQSVYILK